jgi:hypothetical protein
VQHFAVVVRRGLLVVLIAVAVAGLLPVSANATPVVSRQARRLPGLCPAFRPRAGPEDRYDFEGRVTGDECGPS